MTSFLFSKNVDVKWVINFFSYLCSQNFPHHWLHLLLCKLDCSKPCWNIFRNLFTFSVSDLIFFQSLFFICDNTFFSSVTIFFIISILFVSSCVRFIIMVTLFHSLKLWLLAFFTTSFSFVLHLKDPDYFYVLFSSEDFSLWAYHLHDSQWITFPTQSCLIFYFLPSLQHSPN